MEFPDDLYYSKDHEWLRVEGDEGTVGITDFAQRELGDIVFVDIEKEGEALKESEEFGIIEAVKTVSELFLPVSGEIYEVNQVLNDKPENINNDPYQSGWIVKIKIADKSELDHLMQAQEYMEMVGEF